MMMLKHESTLFYQTSGTKRKQIPANSPKPHIVRRLTLNLPSFLMEETWNRYNYSLDDIFSTLKIFKSFFLWHLALVEFLTITNSSCKRSTDQINQFIVSSKQIVSSKLRRHFQTKYKSRSKLPSVLDSRSIHSPPLPLITTDDAIFFHYMADRCVGSSYQHFDPNLPHQTNDGALFVPRELEGKNKNKIWMNRIQPKEVYIAQFGSPQSLTMAPGEIMINDVVYVFMEESYSLQLKE